MVDKAAAAGAAAWRLLGGLYISRTAARPSAEREFKFRQAPARSSAAYQARGRRGRYLPQGDQRLADITAHLRDKHPDQRRDTALHLDLLDHADTTLADRLAHMLQHNLPQHPPPSPP